MNPKFNTISKSNLSYLIETIVKGIIKELDSSDQSSNSNKKAEKISSLALKKAKGNKNLAYKIIQRGIDKCNEPEFKKTLQSAAHILQSFSESTTNEETVTGAVSPITSPYMFIKKNKPMEILQPLGGMEEVSDEDEPAKYDDLAEVVANNPNLLHAMGWEGLTENDLNSKSKKFFDFIIRHLKEIQQIGNFRYVDNPKDLEVDWYYKSQDKHIDEMTTTGGGGDSSAGTPGYNIPGFLSKKGGSKAGVQGSEKLGFTLTIIGKDEMERPADKLIEGKVKNCSNCVMMNINGIPTHEQGCPSVKKTKSPVCSSCGNNLKLGPNGWHCLSDKCKKV